MSKLRYLLVLTALAVGIVSVGLADDPKKDDTKDEVFRTKLSEKKRSCCFEAKTVNFAKELNVPLDYLGSLGNRISQARKAPDPVELALCSQGLGVAEKVAGKKASVTAAEIMQEALELAKLRGIPAELTAMLAIVPDQKTQEDLTKSLNAATEFLKAEKAKTDSGERQREIHGMLTVINHTDECLNIYVSGRYVGIVHTGQTASFYVQDYNHITEVDAYCAEGGELIRHGHAHGHHHDMVWHIDPQ